MTPGSEFAGEIEAVGRNITSLKAGERVFGFDDLGAGAHAEYLCIAESHALAIPEGISCEQAAAGSEGAHYAYNFINKVAIKSGQHILVNGATGAIGSAAVQLLAHLGVHVTAVCATPHMETVKALGAECVIDYTQEDFTHDDQTYHYVFDTVGKSSFFKCFRLLKPSGVYISSDLGYLWQSLYLPLITSIAHPLLGNKRCVSPFPEDIPATLRLIRRLRVEGKFRALIDRSYSFDEIVEAYRYVEKGHKTGNVVITIQHGGNT